MSDSADELDQLLDRVSEEFAGRCRSGEFPAIESYTQRYPEIADKISQIFPSIAMMESLGRRQHSEVQLAQHLATGSKLPFEELGDFKIVREIGRGGMGIVLEAVQKTLGRHVAIKVLSKHAMLEENHLRRFEREAQTASRLHHTNIVPVFGVGKVDDYNFIVMQLIEGIGIDALIKQYRRYRLENTTSDCESIIEFADRIYGEQTQGVNQSAADSTDATLQPTAVDVDAVDRETNGQRSFKFEQQLELRHFECVAQLGKQIAAALAYAHQQGVLHRDIKPGNLLLDQDGVAWIADFGLAKAFEQDDVTRTNDIIGTIRYMAPEQLHAETTAVSDIYSLGLTLFELLTLTPVFNDRSFSSLRSIAEKKSVAKPSLQQRGIPVDLETIVLKSCAIEPSERYDSAAEMADDLEAFLNGQPIKARPRTKAEILFRWCRDNPLVSGLSALTFAMLLFAATSGIIGYATATAALKREHAALSVAVKEKENAEENLQIAVDVLNGVAERLAPATTTFATSFDDNENEPVEIRIRPQVSPGTLQTLEQLVEFFNEFTAKYKDRPNLKLAVAKANVRIGDIRFVLGDFENAESAYSEGLTTFELFRDEAPTEIAPTLDVSDLLTKLGAVRKEIYKFERENRELFGEDFRRANSLLQPLLQDTDLQPEELLRAAGIYYRIGKSHVPDQRIPGRGPDAKNRGGRGFGQRPPPPPRQDSNPDLDRAISLLNRIEQTGPAREYLMALCYRDQPPEWDNGLEQAADLLTSLDERFPDNPDYLFALSQTYDRFALREIDSAESEDFLRRSMRLTTRLVAQNPSNYQFVTAHVGAQFKLAMLLIRGERQAQRPSNDRTVEQQGSEPEPSGNRQQAVALLRSAVKFQDGLVAKYPDDEHRVFNRRLKTILRRVESGAVLGRPNRDDGSPRRRPRPPRKDRN